MVAEGFNPRHQPALKAGLPSAATPWLNPQNFGNTALGEKWHLLSGDLVAGPWSVLNARSRQVSKNLLYSLRNR